MFPAPLSPNMSKPSVARACALIDAHRLQLHDELAQNLVLIGVYEMPVEFCLPRACAVGLLTAGRCSEDTDRIAPEFRGAAQSLQ
jgi:hypothetical protein